MTTTCYCPRCARPTPAGTRLGRLCGSCAALEPPAPRAPGGDRMACGHPERPHYARGRCKACYDTARAKAARTPAAHRQPRACECGHPERPHYALGLCRACYDARRLGERKAASDAVLKARSIAHISEVFRGWAAARAASPAEPSAPPIAQLPRDRAERAVAHWIKQCAELDADPTSKESLREWARGRLSYARELLEHSL